MPLLAAVLALQFVSCGSARVTQAERQANLNGYWNDNDVREVCDKLIRDCLLSNNVDRFVSLNTQNHNGERPAAIVLPFKNYSKEHIDTQIISNNLRASIIGSGKLDFVEGTAAMGNGTGARLAFTGEVRSIIDTAGNVSTRTYYVKATLTNMETNRILWEGKETVRKNIKRSAAAAGIPGK
jgi:PBP1b-binding outer membrane lipoprotein LpoB